MHYSVAPNTYFPQPYTLLLVLHCVEINVSMGNNKAYLAFLNLT